MSRVFACIVLLAAALFSTPENPAFTRQDKATVVFTLKDKSGASRAPHRRPPPRPFSPPGSGA